MFPFEARAREINIEEHESACGFCRPHSEI